MTLIQIVKELRKRGHSVIYRKRGPKSDAISIVSIDSERFTAASRAGNKRARQMVGEEISTALTAKRKRAGVLGGKARGAQRTAQARVRAAKPKRPPTKAEIREKREFERLRRIAKKRGLKAIGRRQVTKAKKRGKKWSEIRQDIIATYKARYSKVSSINTIDGLAIYIRDHNLSAELADFLQEEAVFGKTRRRRQFMATDIQELKEAAYDAVMNGTPFNEKYWLDRMRESSNEAEGGYNDLRSFEKELRKKI